ncbi:hypothetical protein D3C84_900820 [compost metagenome]
MAAGQVFVGLVFDELPVQPLAAIDIDEHRTRVLAQQGLQGRGVDDGCALQLLRRRAAVQVDAVAIGGEQRGVGLRSTQQQAQRQGAESKVQQARSGTRHGYSPYSYGPITCQSGDIGNATIDR